MSALIFPTVGLTTGTQYTGDNGVTYVYDGVKWVGHGTNLSPGTSSIINNGHVVQVDTTGNLVVPGYVIPATTGTTNQVLTWPTNGNILTWTSTNRSQLSNGSYIVELNNDGTIKFPNDTIDAGTSSVTVSSNVYSELAWRNNAINGDPYETLDSYIGVDTFGTYIVNEYTNSAGTGSNASFWYFDPSGILQIGQIGQVGTSTGIVQNVGADIVDGNGNSLIYVVSTATAPASRLNGQLWFNSVEGRAYIKYEDIWVDLSPTVIAQPSTYLDELSISGTTISQTNTTGTEAVIINNNTSSWQFGTDGKLTFPAGYALPNTVGTAGQVLSVSTNSNVLYWTTASGGLTDVLGVVTFPGDLLIGTLWPDGDDKESVVWAKEDTEYLGLWWGGDQIYPEEFYGPVAGIQIGAGATDDFTNTPSPTGTNITLAINGDMDTLEWVFDRDGVLTLPNGMTIDASDSIPTVTIGGPNTKIRIDDGGAPPGFYITTNATSSTAHGWLFGPDGELQFPRGSTISETTTTTVITPPGALAGQGLVIRTTTGGGLQTTDTFTPGGVVTITFYDNGSYFATGGYTSPGSESNTWTYTITGISQADLGSPLTGAFLGENWAIVNSNNVNTATFSIPALSNGTGFTITLDKIITDPPYRLMGVSLNGAGRNSLTVGSVTTSSEISHVHLTSADPATVDLYLGDDDQYVKIEKNHGNVVVGTNTATNIWTFGTDGNLTLPLETKLNSGGVGVANSAELGTSVTLSTSTVVNSEIYMGSGYGEFRSIYNKVGSTSSGLTYAGVEGFNYAQYGDVNFSGMVSQTPHIDSMYTISVSTTTGLISIGFTQDGGTSVSKDWITVLGTLNTGYTVNGIFADTTQTVIAGGDGVLSSIVKLTDSVNITTIDNITTGTQTWTFGTTGTITFPDATVQTTAWTGILPNPTYSGSDQIGQATPAPLNLNNSAEATLLTQLNLINTGGNAGSGSAIDFWTYTSINDVPEVRLQAVDDGDYSADFAIKIKANGESGSGSLTTSWTFGADGSLTFPDTSTQTTAWNSSTVVRPEQIVGGLPPVVTLTGAVAGFNGAGQLNAQFTVQSNSTVTDVGVLKIGVSGSNLSGVTTATASTGSFDITIIDGVDQATAVVMAYATNAAGTAYSIPLTGTSSVLCLVRGTLVALSDGTSKPVEDITYDDLILAWDFDRGGYAEARPLWIKREETTHNYNLLSFSDGSTLRTVDQHRIFNKEAGAFTYPMTHATPIGTTTYNQHGDEITLIKKERVYDTVAYYNVITDYHMNLFADSILTSCRFNNIYPIVDMQFVKDGKTLRSRSEFANIPDRFYTGLRLSEQTFDLDMIEWYVERLIHMEVNAVALAI